MKAGSVHETDDQQGLAHFVEHMAFNGTERFAKQEIVEYLESIGSTLGPDLNARTGSDDTLYFFEIPTDDPEITETAFQILSDWAFSIAFDPEEVELERGVVLEEWRLNQGFDSRLQQNLLNLLFGDSLYASRAPIGLTEIIKNAPVESLKAYYERWYRPDLMAVVAVGDFDVEDIEGKVKQYFAPPPEGEADQKRAAAGPTTDRPLVEVPGHEIPLIEVFTDPESPATQFVLIRKLDPETGRDLAEFRRTVVERLAFMMLNARLFERGQSAEPPYINSSAGRSAYVETLDIATWSRDRTGRDGRRRGRPRCHARGDSARPPAQLHRRRAGTREKQPAQLCREPVQAAGADAVVSPLRRVHRPLLQRVAGPRHRGRMASLPGAAAADLPGGVRGRGGVLGTDRGPRPPGGAARRDRWRRRR